MNPIGKFIDRITGRESARAQAVADRAMKNMEMTKRHAATAIQAAAQASVSGWPGIQSNRDEDAANKEYMQALPDVLQRSQDLDVNNGDLRGFHRTRTAQICGAHVKFKSNPNPSEVEVDPQDLLKITGEIDRIRALHSRTGGFDSTGNNRTEGEQQERAELTAMVHGCCLIHRVWRPENPILPLSLELIPGVRISTPINRTGDPKLSFGIEYEDTHRTRVVAYHVRKVSKTIGDSFVSDFEWDRLPVEDCSLLSLTEPAGMDRAMPLAVACVRMLRNRTEFVESAVSTARAQAKIYAATEVTKGADPYQAALDDTDETSSTGQGFTDMGDVRMIYTNNGEKINWNNSTLPGPQFKDFNDVMDARLARGVTSSKSRFTREVNSSWAGGRLEDQQDDPIVDQYRRTFCSAWQKVNCWFLEAVWLTGSVEMPGYNSRTQVYWSEFRAEFPGKLHINPQDTMAAREKGYMLRTTTPQQACEEDGKELRENISQWAQAIVILRQTEKKYGLKEGTLDYLISGRTISTSAGDDIGAPTPAPEPQPGEPPAASNKPPLRIAQYGAKK